MTPRRLLRLLLVAFGALVFGALGAAVLGPRAAGATAVPQPPSPLEVRVTLAEGPGSTALGVGPVAVDVPVALPLDDPITIRVQATVTPPEIPEIPETTLPIPRPAIPQPAIPQPAHPPTSTPSASTPSAVVADPPATAPPSVPVPTSSASAAPVAPTPSPPTPSLWTLAFAGADTRGAEQGGSSPFVAVVGNARAVTPRLTAVLVAPRANPSRPGFALRLARPG